MEVGGILAKGKVGNEGRDVDRLYTPAVNTTKSHQGPEGGWQRGLGGRPAQLLQLPLPFATTHHMVPPRAAGGASLAGFLSVCLSVWLAGRLLTCRPLRGS